MTCSIEKILSDARMLTTRLRDHDNNADNLIAQAQTLNRRMEAMKQYQDDLNQLNEIARHRPRANLIMGLLQENNQIRELQQENRDLRNSLEEHQSAIELIMSKYREQVARLMLANKRDQGAVLETDQSTVRNSEEIEDKIDKICEMAGVMQQAIRLDEEHAVEEHKIIAQLKFENQTLRELLKISNSNGSLNIERLEQETQTVDELSDVDTTEDECNRSVIYRGPDLIVEKSDTESVSESQKAASSTDSDSADESSIRQKTPSSTDSDSADESSIQSVSSVKECSPKPTSSVKECSPKPT